jgi:transcriptional regulator with XRE-family HTH domain
MSTRAKTKFGIQDLEKRLGKMSVGEFLRSWRLSEELSQRQFAKRLKISPANLCDLEKGRKGVSPEKAEEIAHILGYSPTVLVRLALTEQLESVGLHYTVDIKPAV